MNQKNGGIFLQVPYQCKEYLKAFRYQKSNSRKVLGYTVNTYQSTNKRIGNHVTEHQTDVIISFMPSVTQTSTAMLALLCLSARSSFAHPENAVEMREQGKKSKNKNRLTVTSEDNGTWTLTQSNGDC
jgi:hypothetical protein